MARADESQDPVGPKEAAGLVSGGPVSHTEGPIIAVEPLQSVPLAEGSKDPKISPTAAFLGGDQGQVPSVVLVFFFF